MPFGTDAVTLYNRRESKDTNGRTVVTWHRRAIPGCFWTRRNERIREGNSTTMSDVIVCKIPEDPDYREPSEWDVLPYIGDLFTLAPGDIIVRGVVADQIGAGLTSAALSDKHRRSGVMTVTSAQNNARPGFPLGHYLAKGV